MRPNAGSTGRLRHVQRHTRPPTRHAYFSTTPSATPKPIDPQLLADLEMIIANKGEAETEMTDSIKERIEENPSGAVTAILPKLSDINQSEEALAVYAWAIGWTGDASAIDPLSDLAQSTDSDRVKVNCINSLSNFQGRQAGEKLISLYEETTDPDQQYSILNALAEMQYEPALPLMGKTLEVDPNEEYWKPIFIFRKMGDLGVPYLLDKIEDQNKNIKTNAILLLSRWLIAPDAAQPLLRAVLD
jgi:hypothetical protein